MKKFILSCLGFFFMVLCFSQTTLTSGDILITGFNSNPFNDRNLSFVFFRDIVAGTTIKFTDIGWSTSTGGFISGDGTGYGSEGVLVWVADVDYSCGTEVIITDDSIAGDNSTFNDNSVDLGNVYEDPADHPDADKGFGIASGTDQVIIYQGSHTSPSLITAVQRGQRTWTSPNIPDTASRAQDSDLPAGLTANVDAFYFGDFDNGRYNCDISSGKTLVKHLISDYSYWTQQNAVALGIGGCSYTCCSSEVTWDGATWSPSVPDINTTAIINGDYNTVNGGNEVSFSACSLFVTSGNTLTIANGDFVEIENDALIDGNLVVKTAGAFVQNEDGHNFLNHESGSSTVEKETAPAYAWYEYTYWSSPVKEATIANGLTETQVGRRFYFNAQNYLDAKAETGNNNATVDGQDNIDDNGDDWSLVGDTHIMSSGAGYAATHDKVIFESSMGSPKQFVYTFDGELNNGVVNVPVFRNDIETNDINWNFIGNPFASAISADAFFTANGDLDGAIYLWAHTTPASRTANGNQVSNFSDSDYAIINSGTGEVVGGDLNGDGIVDMNDKPERFIPSCQGFFVSYSNSATPVSSNGNIKEGSVTFNNAMRVIGSTNNSQFFKTSKPKEIHQSSNFNNKIWIDLTSDTGIFNQILIGYVDGASKKDDGAKYDAVKFVTNKNSAGIYSTIKHSNKKFAIQGRGVRDLNGKESFGIGFSTAINNPTIYKLSVGKLQGGFLNNSKIYLKDKFLQRTHEISLSPYTFTSEVGEFKDRFEVVFKTNKFSNNNFVSNKDAHVSMKDLGSSLFEFSTSNNDVFMKSIKISDFSGRTVYNIKTNLSSDVLKLTKLEVNNFYIVHIKLSNGTNSIKKFLKK